MQILVDTNLVLRAVQTDDPRGPVAVGAIRQCLAAGHRLVFVPQIIYEFWVVATRPVDVNGLGMSVADTSKKITELMEVFTLLRDERMIFDHWLQLVQNHRVTGKNGHDARLVAAMQKHGIKHLLTFNSGDFARYPNVTILSPAEVIQGTPSPPAGE